jgi:hypothetical protein
MRNQRKPMKARINWQLDEGKVDIYEDQGLMVGVPLVSIEEAGRAADSA